MQSTAVSFAFMCVGIDRAGFNAAAVKAAVVQRGFFTLTAFHHHYYRQTVDGACLP